MLSGDLLVVVLPLVALILASLSIGGLWYWWTSTRDEEEGDSTGIAEPELGERPAEGTEPTVGQIFGRLVRSVTPAAEQPQPSPMFSGVAPVASGGAVEVLRVLRDLSDGALVVEIEGQRFYRLDDIADPEIRRRFVGNARALAEWVRQGGQAAPPPGDAPAPQAASPSQGPSVESVPQTQSPVVPPPGPLPSALRSRPEPPPEPQAKRGGLFQRKPAESDAEQVPMLSMAQEIEELLQFRLTLNPAMAQRSIHIRDAVGGGVRIEVDGAFYGGVDDVADEAVRAFIQDTIREWEARQ